MAWKFPDQLPKTASSRDHALVRLTLLTNEGFSISAAKVLATSRNQGQNASSVAFLFIGYFAISFLILSNLPIAMIEGAQSTVATRARSRYALLCLGSSKTIKKANLQIERMPPLTRHTLCFDMLSSSKFLQPRTA